MIDASITSWASGRSSTVSMETVASARVIAEATCPASSVLLEASLTPAETTTILVMR